MRDGRGGYCYEQNLLFREVLKTLGFAVTGLAARVLWNVPEGVVLPRTHMLLLIDIDGAPHVADVGFGGQTLTGPLRLEPDVEQATPHEPFRLVRSGEQFVMQSKIRESWFSLYRFDLQEQLPPDYEVYNWYVSTHPQSIFVNGLLAGRAAARSPLRPLEQPVGCASPEWRHRQAHAHDRRRDPRGATRPSSA